MSEIEEQILTNYLMDNSLIYNNLKYRMPQNKFKSNKKIYRFNKDFNYLLMNYVMLRNNEIELRIKNKKKKKFEANIENYSKNAIEMLESKVTFFKLEKRILKQNILNYNKKLFIDDKKIFQHEFLKKCMLKYDSDLQFNNILKNSSLKKTEDINKVLNYFYEYIIKFELIDDNVISIIKRSILEEVLKEDRAMMQRIFTYVDKRKEHIKKNSLLHYRKQQKNNTALFSYIRSINIISSSHNHTTLKHNIKNITVLIDYRNNGIIKPLKFNIHYCENCKTYFDFEKSFYNQYKFINYDQLIINIRHIKDSYFINESFTGMLTKSVISKLGYKVGISGISRKKREEILKYAIESGLITVSELKSHLEFCINFFKHKSNMHASINDWKSDIEYISKNQLNFQYKRKYID